MKKQLELDKITEKIISVAIDIHKELGPGLLESTYESCMVYGLVETDLKVKQQKPLPVVYKGVKLDCVYRLDLFVEDEVIVELKSVEKFLPIHKAQLLSYLKLSGCRVGLLINFNVEILKNGLHRIVNNYPDAKRAHKEQNKY